MRATENMRKLRPEDLEDGSFESKPARVGVRVGSRLRTMITKSLRSQSGMIEVITQDDGYFLTKDVFILDADEGLQEYKIYYDVDEKRQVVEDEDGKEVQVRHGKPKSSSPPSSDETSVSDPEETVLSRMEEGQLYKKKDLASGLSKKQWRDSINALMEAGTVSKKGKRRGTRYFLSDTDPEEVPTIEEAQENRAEQDAAQLLERIADNEGSGKSDLIADLSAARWNEAIHYLLEADKIKREGAGRWTVYYLSDTEVPADQTSTAGTSNDEDAAQLLERIAENEGSGKSDLIGDLSAGRWNDAINSLLDAGKIRKEGKRRWTVYFLAE